MFNSNKETVQIYRCQKCGFQKDIINNMDREKKCKICGSQMIFQYERAYNPKMGLAAIKKKEPHKKTIQTKSQTQKAVITCPYCKSTDTQKISGLSKAGSVALFGIFSQKVKKQWHCNNCKSDF